MKKQEKNFDMEELEEVIKSIHKGKATLVLIIYLASSEVFNYGGEKFRKLCSYPTSINYKLVLVSREVVLIKFSCYVA